MALTREYVRDSATAIGRNQGMNKQVMFPTQDNQIIHSVVSGVSVSMVNDNVLSVAFRPLAFSTIAGNHAFSQSIEPEGMVHPRFARGFSGRFTNTDFIARSVLSVSFHRGGMFDASGAGATVLPIGMAHLNRLFADGAGDHFKRSWNFGCAPRGIPSMLRASPRTVPFTRRRRAKARSTRDAHFVHDGYFSRSNRVTTWR